jgi:anhydro-N-acetylmuramic acid kinase
MSVTTRLIAGAMSGTSADGVDVAIVRIDGRGLAMTAQLVAHHYRAYDPALRRAIFSVRETGQTTLADLARIGREISLAHAACVNEAIVGAGLSAKEIAAVAAHGQTLHHAPPDTIQWLDPALVAAETGCPVVSDFRRADCAAGGQGAPLVPFADYILFRHPTQNRVLLNIGGIANITALPADSSIEELQAFDTGPGNCLSDYLMREFDPAGPGMDVDARIAIGGKFINDVFDRFLAHPFFCQSPPKSTDSPTMIRAFDEAREHSPDASLPDLLATSSLIAAAALADAIDGIPFPATEIIVSGGGTRNPALMGILRDRLQQDLKTTHDFPAQAKEAIAFALLGAATLDGEPSNIPSCTGARRRVVLGSITPRQ